MSDCPSREARTEKELETSTAIGTFSEDLWLLILFVGIKPSLESLSSRLDFLELPSDLFAFFSLLEVFSLSALIADFTGWCLSLGSDVLELLGFAPEG